MSVPCPADGRPICQEGKTLPNAKPYRSLWAAFLAAWVAFSTGCNQQNQYNPPPPPKVTVALPLQQNVTNYLEETGTTEAVEQVAVRARVKGFLEEIHFEAGDDVSAGDESTEADVLYVIEQCEFKAKVDGALADLNVQKAELARAQAEYDRELELQSQDATSERDVVAAKAARDVAKASVDVASAALELAQRDLDYTKVRAPISGRVEKTLVKRGNLVDGVEATQLTTIMQYDPIYANFNISERVFLRILDRTRDQDRGRIDKEQIKLYLQRANDKGFPFEGHFDYADLAVDQSTGTYMIRGIFPNPDRVIVPGLFVRIQLPLGTRENALLVPEMAVGADQRGRYVLVVDDKNQVHRHNVSLGPRQADMVVVEAEEDGLDADDWVIVDGLQRARPGAEVTPERTKLTAPKSEQPVPAREDPHADLEAGTPPPEGEGADDAADGSQDPMPADATTDS